MSEKVKKIRVKQKDGSMSDYIPIGADASNIDMQNGLDAETIIGKKPYYFNSVAAMKAAEYLKEGDCAITLGYYKPNDGGAGDYTIVSGEYTDDGGSIHVLSNGLYAELITKNGEVNVKQFGAYGDEINNDTNVIQKAINSNYNIIYFPKGTYLLSDPIKIISNKTLYGDGLFSILTAHRGINLIENKSTEDVKNIKIESLTFLGNVVREEDINVYPKRKVTFKNSSYGNGVMTAINLEGSLAKREVVTGILDNVIIRKCNFLDIYSLPSLINGGSHIIFSENYTDNCLDIGFIDCNNILFDNNYVIRGADNGVSISSGNNNVTCTNNIFLYSAMNGIWISGWPIEVSGINPDTGKTEKMQKMFYGPTNVVINSNIIKHCGHSGILGKWYCENIIISNNIIDDCRFGFNGEPSESQEAGNGIRIGGWEGYTVGNDNIRKQETKIAKHITITGNKVSNCARGGVALIRATDFHIDNNTFLNLGSKNKIDGSEVPSLETHYNHGIYVANYDETLQCNGTIFMNTFKEEREDKNTVNYINYKYALSKTPFVKIKDNIFYDYNETAKYFIYGMESKNNIILDDYRKNKFNMSILTLFSDTITSISDITNKFQSSNIDYECTWQYKPIATFCDINVTKMLTNNNENIESYGTFIRGSNGNVFFNLFSINGNQYMGALNANSIIKLSKINGTTIELN